MFRIDVRVTFNRISANNVSFWEDKADKRMIIACKVILVQRIMGNSGQVAKAFGHFIELATIKF